MHKFCSIPDCDKAVVARGYCCKHYERFKKHGDPLKINRVAPGSIPFCTVEGCGRPHFTKGLCQLHAQRARKHGDPLVVKTVVSRRGAPLAWLRKQSTVTTDECIIWPFRAHYKNGYGSLWIDGKITGAHRAMCALAHGEPPSPTHQSAHSCNNRRCVNPHHLRWATQSENELDKIAVGNSPRGVRNPQAKLTEDDVRSIVSMKGSQTHKSIAAQFGVDRKTIGHIYSGLCWSHITSEIGGSK